VVLDATSGVGCKSKRQITDQTFLALNAVVIHPKLVQELYIRIICSHYYVFDICSRFYFPTSSLLRKFSGSLELLICPIVMLTFPRFFAVYHLVKDHSLFMGDDKLA
jgi:hypothetical protein